MFPPITDILVATDFSPTAVRAADRAARLARVHGARLRLVHALQDPGWMAAAAADPDLPLELRDIEDVLSRALAAEAARLAEDDGPVPCQVLRGPLPHAVAAQLATSPADLLVMGAHGETGWEARIFGSTAERMLQAELLPVLLVKAEVRRSYRRIALATDFSEASLHAARFGMALAPDAEAVVFHAHLTPFAGALEYANVPAADREAHARRASMDAMRSLEAFASRLPRAAAPSLHTGAPAATLAGFAAAAGIDLVVLGTRGRSALGRHLLGSTARHAAGRLDCDVLVVPGVEG